MISGAGAGVVVLATCGKQEKVSETAAPTTGATGATPTTGAAGAAPPVLTVTPEMFGSAAACTVTPAQTEGPYYIDVDKVRSDIREDRPGARLRLAARVLAADGCTPVKDAVFEIWHCDAGGVYSGFSAGQGGGPGGRPGGASAVTDGSRFLRGAQVTNGDGIAEITTIYPGWYRGRTVHIHSKVFLSNTEVLTTQLYFDDKLSEAVFATAPYNGHSGRDTFNSGDNIFSDKTIVTVSRDGDGYLALMTIGVRR